MQRATENRRYLPSPQRRMSILGRALIAGALLATCLLPGCGTATMPDKTDTTGESAITVSLSSGSEDTMDGPLQNTPLITSIYTADPSAHVFNGQLFIYPSHDRDEDFPASNDGGQYQMNDYHVLLLDGLNTPCKDMGVALSLADIPWADRQLWAPDAAYRDGKYYLYFPAKDKDQIFRIGVATSDSPSGPFTAEDSYIPGSFSIDPAVYVEGDSAYMLFGGLMGGQLEKWQTGEYLAYGEAPEGDEPALGPEIAALSSDMLSFAETPRQISIVDDTGRPIAASDEDRRFFEAVWLHKYNGHYYLSYSTGTTHYLVYAMSDSIYGPYVYKGRILDPVEGWTTHHSIVEYEGHWYLFYHDSSLSGGVDSKRCVKYAELFYNDDDSIQKVNR